MSGETDAGKLWGGRFASGPSPELEALSKSTHFDWRLAPYDLAGSRAHAKALHGAGLLTDDEHAALLHAIVELNARWSSGALQPAPSDEDVHSALERQIIEQVGPATTRWPPSSGCTCVNTATRSRYSFAT